MEVIQVRLSGHNFPNLISEFRNSLMDENYDGEIKIFSRAGVSADLIIEISYQSSPLDNEFSSLGLRLAFELREFEIVEHSL